MKQIIAIALICASGSMLNSAEPFPNIVEQINAKCVKLFGGGGYRGVNNYGTGVVVSPDGHILTNSSTLVDPSDIVVHFADGRRMKAKAIATEPLLDAMILELLDTNGSSNTNTSRNLPYFNIGQAADLPPPSPGDWVLAFTNLYEIAMRDEPVSVQKGVLSAITKLAGRRGIFEFSYPGDVYVVDAIINNPGAAGGALTDRQGRFLGLIGREIRNVNSETFINYAIPVHSQIEVPNGDQKSLITFKDFVARGIQKSYKPVGKIELKPTGPPPYHGIVFVPDLLPRTPPYVDRVRSNSPAAIAGIQPDDLISFVDGEPVSSIRLFQDIIRRSQVNQTLRIEVRRGTRLMTLEVKLASSTQR